MILSQLFEIEMLSSKSLFLVLDKEMALSLVDVKYHIKFNLVFISFADSITKKKSIIYWCDLDF